ncbi:50S ribosomal protein L15e [Candidatus Woesearchaeota archaeon]|nr:50S ribosomal protein L15e [Candidatus Woesearchaeota archaeon]
MGMHKHLANLWKGRSMTERMIGWRQEPATVRLTRPTKLSRARTLGYKAKSGIIVVRQRVDRGGRKRPDIKGGRRSKHARQIKILDMNYRAVAEQRASQKYPNMEVMNSYFVGKDGTHYWHEIILADRMSPELAADSNLNWILSKKGRANRGLTSAARKSRGLRHRGKGAEKMRPSRTASTNRKYRRQRRDLGY